MNFNNSNNNKNLLQRLLRVPLDKKDKAGAYTQEGAQGVPSKSCKTELRKKANNSHMLSGTQS